MKKRICFVFVLLIVCFIFSSCVESTSALINDLSDPGNENVSKTINELVSRGKEAVVPLQEALKSPDPNIRANACQALYQIEGDKAAAEIVPLMGDTNPKVISVAINCIGKMGRAGVAAMAAFCYERELKEYKQNITRTLDTIGSDAVDYLVQEYAASVDEEYKTTLITFYLLMGKQKYPQTLNIMETGGENKEVILNFIKYDFHSFANNVEPTQLLKLDVPADEIDVWLDAVKALSVTDMIKIYDKETDATIKKTELKNIIRVCNKTDNFKDFWANMPWADLQTIFGDLLESMNRNGIESFVAYYDTFHNREILKSVDKDKLWSKLYPLLEEEDSRTVYLIGDLDYPEYFDRILAYIQKNIAEGNYSYYAEPLLDGYKDDKVLEIVKAYVSADKRSCFDDLINYYKNRIPVDAYTAGINYTKEGSKGGAIKEVVVIEKGYFDGPVVSDYTYSLVPTKNWLSITDPRGADAAIYIKDAYKYTCKYKSTTTHQKAKGYRVVYTITLVDLRTKKVLASKTVKGPKLPKKIYSGDLWDDGKYYGKEPSDKSIEAAVKKLLKLCV